MIIKSEGQKFRKTLSKYFRMPFYLSLKSVFICTIRLILILMFSYECMKSGWYFDYDVPQGDDFISFYYTTNINKITMTCNEWG